MLKNNILAFGQAQSNQLFRIENNIKVTVDSLLQGMDNVVSSKTVVGDAIQLDGTTIIPLIDVSFADDQRNAVEIFKRNFHFCHDFQSFIES